MIATEHSSWHVSRPSLASWYEAFDLRLGSTCLYPFVRNRVIWSTMDSWSTFWCNNHYMHFFSGIIQSATLVQSLLTLLSRQGFLGWEISHLGLSCIFLFGTSCEKFPNPSYHHRSVLYRYSGPSLLWFPLASCSPFDGFASDGFLPPASSSLPFPSLLLTPQDSRLFGLSLLRLLGLIGEVVWQALFLTLASGMQVFP